MTGSPRAVAPVARASIFVAAVALTIWWAPPCLAQDYPTRPVKIVVPFGAGGPADVYSRVLAQHLSEALKQPFVVEDRPGAGSIIGTDAVAKSPPTAIRCSRCRIRTPRTNRSFPTNRFS